MSGERCAVIDDQRVLPVLQRCQRQLPTAAPRVAPIGSRWSVVGQGKQRAVDEVDEDIPSVIPFQLLHPTLLRPSRIRCPTLPAAPSHILPSPPIPSHPLPSPILSSPPIPSHPLPHLACKSSGERSPWSRRASASCSCEAPDASWSSEPSFCPFLSSLSR